MIRLDIPVSEQAYQDYYDAIPADPVTVMNGKGRRLVNTIGPIIRGDVAYSGMDDTEPRPYGTDDDNGRSVQGVYEDTEPRPYGSPADYFFTTEVPRSEVPILLALAATDKAGTLADVIDAKLYNNPATEGLFTLQLPGSPLVNNMEDTPGVLSGSDPAPFMSGGSGFIGEEPTDPGLELDTTEADNVNIAPGINIKKSVLKETGVFVIGALILVVGIYAMTR